MAKAKKKPTRPKCFWLTRDDAGAADGYYNTHLVKPPPEDYGRKRPGLWELRHGDEVYCTRKFEQFADPSVHLEPGGGPIEVMLVLAR